MTTLRDFYPNFVDLMATPPEDLAPVLLKFARGMLQNGLFWPDSVNDAATGANNIAQPQAAYSFHERQQIGVLLTEAWSWMEHNGLIARAPGMNGRNGHMVLTKRGEEIQDAVDFQRFRQAAAFPKSLLHPSIADKVWRALSRNDLDDAVLAAFKAVEEAVRAAGGFAPTDVGVQLMRKAFDKNTGPLADTSEPEAERDSLAHLFAGAIGYYRNRHAHRTVNLTDLTDAREQVMLASHLLRIVDSRRKT